MNQSEISNFAELINIFQMGKLTKLIIAIFILCLVISFLGKTRKILTKIFPSSRLLILQIVTVISFFISITGTFIVINKILQPSKELLLAIGGAAAVAIGFSLKDLATSLVAGLILLFERPFFVGDRVKFGDIYGEIQNIGLRSVKLLTLDNNLVTIPNSRFITDVVSSANQGMLNMMVSINFYLASDSNIEKAKEILYEAVITSRFVFLQQPVSITAKEKPLATKVAVELKVRAFVFDVKFEEDFHSDVLCKAEHLFNQSGIKRAH